MEKNKKVLPLLTAILLPTFVLAGCTDGDKASDPSQEPAKAELHQDGAEIFEQQKLNVEGPAMSGVVLKQFNGMGPSIIQTEPLPEGYTQLGWTVACTGAGEWRASIVQKEPAWSESACSLEPLTAATYLLDESINDPALEVKVEDDAQIWVTIYAAK